jgi:hypothetical protein
MGWRNLAIDAIGAVDAVVNLPEQYHDIAQRLAAHIEVLAWELLPRGRKQRNLWRVGSLAGEPGQSLAIALTGQKRGRWTDYESGEFGDALDLVAATRCGGDKRAAFRWGCDWLAVPHEAPAVTQREATDCRHTGRQNNREWAERIWCDSRPVRRGDPVDRYLAGRAINLAELGRAPASLRYHPSLWNASTHRAWPTMVAAVTNSEGDFSAVHRTYLWVDPICVTKAPIADGGAKRSLGPCAGGSIKLWRGASGRPWCEMAAGETLVIGEGIEDTLSAVLQQPKWRAVSAVSLSLMAALRLPPEVTTIVLLDQNDPLDSNADRQRRQIIARWTAEGRRVANLPPPVFVKDLNELRQWKRQHQWGGETDGVGRGAAG